MIRQLLEIAGDPRDETNHNVTIGILTETFLKTKRGLDAVVACLDFRELSSQLWP